MQRRRQSQQTGHVGCGLATANRVHSRWPRSAVSCSCSVLRLFMWKWIKRRELIARAESDAPVAERHTGRAPGRAARVPSKYASLHDYLKNRYADSVVLTFGQLEDLLGCALPDSARVQHEWWTSTDRDAGRPACSDAWILAGRKASPNLLARTVVFERTASRQDSRSVE